MVCVWGGGAGGGTVWMHMIYQRLEDRILKGEEAKSPSKDNKGELFMERAVCPGYGGSS